MHDKSCIDPIDVIEDSGTYLFEYQKTQASIDLNWKVIANQQTGWVKPLKGALKMNVDTACFDQLGFVGIGCVIRDSNGKMLGASSRKLEGVFEPLLAELLAIREGLHFAKQWGFSISITESDCQAAVLMDNSGQGLSSAHLLANGIVSLLREAGGGTCHFIPRTDNEVAHTLAKNVISCTTDCVWFDIFLDCIITIVAKGVLSN